MAVAIHVTLVITGFIAAGPAVSILAIVNGTMLKDSVLASSIALLLSSIALFTLGHRVKRSHWLGSLALIAGIAVASVALSGTTIRLDVCVAMALFIGAIITAAFPHWNAIGHASFSATAVSVTAFLAYAVHVLVAAELGAWTLAFGVILLLMQSAALLLLIAHTFEIIDVVCRTKWNRVASSKKVAGFSPMVSLHVPTHNEPPDLVIETLNALAKLDYPSYEVLVIDNNTHDESLWRPVEQHCAKLGSRFRFFHLMPWPGFKSGALNFALKQTDARAEIIGIVDADYLVDRHYLCEVVGHFYDRKIAFVQTPQDYRDAGEHGRYGRALYLSYLYFFKISMAVRNEYNGIIFVGTMGLIRRSALEEVGAWDEWCITEDAELSCRLLSAGYESVYIDKSYGRGLMPLDYAGLKKQRFRWAFGGMQLLRMHAGRLLNPWSDTKLTFAQRFAYLSGGLQWLNDPLTLGFTIVLLVGASALLLGGSLFLQPLVGAVVMTPLLFIVFAVMRFLWAFRVRAACTWRDAADALTILMGLTWIVALACVKGLVSRQGVFLRTPKQPERQSLIDAGRIVLWESALALISVGLALALILQKPFDFLSARTITIALLLWQSLTYISAARTSVWSYRAATVSLDPGRKPVLRSVPYLLGRLIPERRIAAWVVVAAILLSALFLVAVRSAPLPERHMRADPAGIFLAARSVLRVTDREIVLAKIAIEEQAARRGDAETALRLWHPAGLLVDANFTADTSKDDRAWRGVSEITSRYEHEFATRRYLQLEHRNPDVAINGDNAIVTNDLYAVIETDRGRNTVDLHASDRWTFRRFGKDWKIVRLEVNRTRGQQVNRSKMENPS